MKKENTAGFKKYIIYIILIILICLILVLFSISMKNVYKKNINDNLINSSNNYSDALNQKVSDVFVWINSTANMVATYDDLNDKKILALLKLNANDNNFARLAVATKDGTSVLDDGSTINISDRAYFKQALNGENAVSGLLESKVDSRGCIVFTCPIHKNNEIVGVLRATINVSEFDKLINIKKTSDVKDVFIINSTGTILNSNTSDKKIENFYQILTNSKLKQDNYLYNFESDLIDKQRNLIEYNYNNENLYAYYKPIGINDWFIITVKSKEELSLHSKDVIIKIFIFIAGIILTFSLFFINIFIKQKKILERVRISEERYKIINEQSEDIIFEFNISEKSISVSDNFVEKLGYEPVLDDIPNKFLAYDIVNTADEKVLLEFFDNIELGKSNNEACFRLKKGMNNYIWCKVIATTIYDENNKPIKAVGRIQDIDSQIKEKEILQEEARRDSLTGMYNKLATKSQIEMYLTSNPDEKAAFIFIDIDNLKVVNDNFGHEFGDKTIIEIASKIKMLFRASDILGRIGTDEFVVFLKNVTAEKLLLDKINELKEILRSTFKNNDVECSISGSMGISLFPNDASDFSGLYKKADAALYSAKLKGKDCFEFYKDL